MLQAVKPFLLNLFLDPDIYSDGAAQLPKAGRE